MRNLDVRISDGVMDWQIVFFELLSKLVGLVFKLLAQNRPWGYLGHLINDSREPPSFQSLDERFKMHFVDRWTNFLSDGRRKIGD